MRAVFRNFLFGSASLKKGNSALEAVLKDVLDHYTTGVVFFDSHGCFLMANRVARAYLPELRLDNQAGLALTFSRFIDFLYDHSVDCDDSLKNALSQRGKDVAGVLFREVIPMAGGDLCLVEAKKTGLGHALFILSNISRVKEREDRLFSLNKNNYRLYKAMQSATNGIVVADAKIPACSFIFVNDAFCAFFDLKADEVLGRAWTDLPHLVSDPSIAQSLLHSFVSNAPADVELSVQNGSSRRWFSLKTSEVQDSSGRPDLYVGVFSETTALKIREAETFQAHKLEALGKLAGGVAHDFNNILSIIDGFSTMAFKKVVPDSEIGGYLLKIQAAAKRGSALTGKMLTFSRHKVVSHNVLDLCALVEEQTILLNPLVDASIRFKVIIGACNLRVSASEDSLSQCLMNLVVNARDAMPDGGSLTIELRACAARDLPERIRDGLHHDRFAALSVRDTGIGMDQKTRERVFDPFYTTKAPGKGTGLGLSIVYGLVSEMGGVLHVESQPGAGTNFTLYLPLSEGEVSRQISGDAADPSTLRLKGVTVLIAEDEPDLRMIVSEMLGQMGATVLQASNGNEALLVQDRHDGPIDILLSDVVMPEINGVKLAQLLCSLRPDMRVIFMSGYPNSGEMAPVEVPEGAAFLPKPVDYNRLVLTLYDAARSSRGGRPEAPAGDEVQPHRVSVSSRVH